MLRKGRKQMLRPGDFVRNVFTNQKGYIDNVTLGYAKIKGDSKMYDLSVFRLCGLPGANLVMDIALWKASRKVVMS